MRGGIIGAMNDPRISIAKRCLGTLEKQRPRGLGAELKAMRETIYSLSYYPDPRSIKDYLKISKYSLLAAAFAGKLRRLLPDEDKPSMAAQTTLYCLRILEGVEDRMDLKDPLCMIDVFYGEVITASKLIPGKLQLCLVDAGTTGSGYYGGHSLRVVTNDLSIKAGQVIPVAMLPPREVGGVISEGMFITERKDSDRMLVGKRPTIAEEAGPASGIIGEFLASSSQ